MKYHLLLEKLGKMKVNIETIFEEYQYNISHTTLAIKR
jgi:hypothetical protein